MAAGAKDPVVLYVSGGNTQVRLPEVLQGLVHASHSGALCRGNSIGELPPADVAGATILPALLHPSMLAMGGVV